MRLIKPVNLKFIPLLIILIMIVAVVLIPLSKLQQHAQALTSGTCTSPTDPNNATVCSYPSDISNPFDFTVYSTVPNSNVIVYPYNVVYGADGNIWFLDSFETSVPTLYRMTPNGTITAFSMSNNYGVGQIINGPNGNIWFTEIPSVSGSVGKIGYITSDGAITDYPVSGSVNLGNIIKGPDGNLWVTDQGALWQVTPTGGATKITLPSEYGNSLGSITSGPDGNLWFISNHNIVQLTLPVNLPGTYTAFSIPSVNNDPYDIKDIIKGSGNNLWFIYTDETSGNANIGEITTSGGITEYPIPNENDSFGVTNILENTDGNVWFTTAISYSPASASYGVFGSITPSGTITEFPIDQTNISPNSFTNDPNGNLWAPSSSSDNNQNAIIRIATGITNPTPTFTLTPTPTPTSNKKPTSHPISPITGSAGNLYFCTSTKTLCTTPIPNIGAFTAGVNLTMVCERSDRKDTSGRYPSDRWFYVKLADGREGFVNASTVDHPSPVPSCDTVKAVAATLWATNLDGQDVYEINGNGFCLEFVYDAYYKGANKFDIGGPVGDTVSAVQWMNAHKSKLRTDNPTPPRGALVFWNGYSGPNGIPNYPDGHVAISLGNGYTESTLERGTKTVHLMKISDRNASQTAVSGLFFSSLYAGYILP